jgi:1-phosphofructokinase
MEIPTVSDRYSAVEVQQIYDSGLWSTVAAARLGAVVVPIIPIYRRDEVGHVLDDAQVSAIVTACTSRASTSSGRAATWPRPGTGRRASVLTGPRPQPARSAARHGGRRCRVSPLMPETVVVLAPSPLITITIEDRAGEPDIHVHAGGQGVWQARMLDSLGVRVVLCAGLGGETGDVLSHLIPGEGIELRAVRLRSRNGGYVHDRRDGDRTVIAQAPGGAQDRHEQDELYELALAAGLEHGTALLSGPHDDRVLPATFYRRLATDLQANGVTVAVDLSGERFAAAMEGRPALVKISHEELVDDGLAASAEPADLIAAMRTLRSAGAGIIVVSRAADPALALVDDDVVSVRVPPLQTAEPKGAGDSMTAGMVATLARGGSPLDALRTGAACGALNVVHHGLGTGSAGAVAALADRVEIATCDDDGAERH